MSFLCESVLFAYDKSESPNNLIGFFFFSGILRLLTHSRDKCYHVITLLVRCLRILVKALDGILLGTADMILELEMSIDCRLAIDEK